MDEEERESESKWQLSTIWWGLFGIAVVGGLSTYVYLNSLKYELSNSGQENRDTVITNVDSPLIIDSDNDGLIDGREEFYGTDPYHPDTDRDGYSDGFEILNGYNPLGKGKLIIYAKDDTNTNN
ncbi:hypothetical protein KKI23_03265 [Patescibacteria group bacterium]|nr:hypothetical protein [Patescibacteria group bacterium]